jgi:hypothetical protein
VPAVKGVKKEKAKSEAPRKEQVSTAPTFNSEIIWELMITD